MEEMEESSFTLRNTLLGLEQSLLESVGKKKGSSEQSPAASELQKPKTGK